jgi:uncharacterized RDD family membrane protein YckC
MHTTADSLLRTPSLRRRMACWLYEAMLLFGVVFAASAVFELFTGAKGQQHTLMQAFFFVVFGIYFVWFWSKGQTLAMKTWYIRVADAHGAPVRQGRALLRYLLCWLWVLPPLAAMTGFKLRPAEMLVLLLGWVAVWALLSRFVPSRQFLHDQLAGTRLIDTRPA